MGPSVWRQAQGLDWALGARPPRQRVPPPGKVWTGTLGKVPLVVAARVGGSRGVCVALPPAQRRNHSGREMTVPIPGERRGRRRAFWGPTSPHSPASEAQQLPCTFPGCRRQPQPSRTFHLWPKSLEFFLSFTRKEGSENGLPISPFSTTSVRQASLSRVLPLPPDASGHITHARRA